MAGQQSDSEEKTLPPSDKKLRDARKRGQVSKSQDMVTAMTLLGCTLTVAIMLPAAEAQVRALFDLAAQLYVEPFDDVWPRLLEMAERLLLATALPILAVTVGCAVLTNIVTMRGVVFSGEPIKPDFKRINPVDGFKRIFSMRSLIEVLKALIKVSLLSVALFVVGKSGLQALMGSSRCGTDCMVSVAYQLLIPLVVTVLIAYLALGGLDLLLQRWLFRREMRMTWSEQKRERKDIDGDPLIKRERQRLMREMQGLSSRRTGLENASLMIGTEDGWLVGVRYVRGETPVPVVVCSASPGNTAQLLAQSAQLQVPRFSDAQLAERIGKRTVAGDPIPANVFQAVADALVAARLI
ncbi:EscU/YscU/HrcU family type III secretion system export apparatus switch protein [Pseudomonas sp. DNDY-54]|uniref:EscU/YscU/HrcU family type III secretion system export apparatus switch protein n=1 Tax=Pseudomonas sp. DNDY-54 TaxID=2870860 RepID=UPI001CA450F7|nr:EscU/YscU/HrcU family type III secretion system export apparatus switch protein [Pseudomonas sp. DNDY-54]